MCCLTPRGTTKVEQYSDDRVSKRKLHDDGSDVLDAAQLDKKKDAAVTALTMGFAGTKGAMSRADVAEFLARQEENDGGKDENAVAEDSDEDELHNLVSKNDTFHLVSSTFSS